MVISEIGLATRNPFRFVVNVDGMPAPSQFGQGPLLPSAA